MWLFLAVLSSIFLFITGCTSKVKADEEFTDTKKIYKTFDGNYNEDFNDVHEYHIISAALNGISPLDCRADTSLYLDKLVRLPKELSIYNTDTLKYSIPYLVKDASDLLTDICVDFKDSLISKKITIYKPIITSVTRTSEDIQLLTRRNRNAKDISAHQYATTFDISWRRFQKEGEGEDVPVDKLKFVLAEVLYNLKERERCYVKHERKQACFHITVR